MKPRTEQTRTADRIAFVRRFFRGMLALWLVLLVATVTHAAVINNDTFWKDTSGNPIYSQGGGIFKFGSTYYWYGVRYNGAATYYNKPTSKNSDSSFYAVTCYSSTDLVNWKFENNVLTSSDPNLSGTTWLGRLGVVYNANTGKYVLISQQYSAALGNGDLFATCNTPTGNFVFNNKQATITNVSTGLTGDQTVFTDDDGQSYLVCSNSSGRANLYVARIRPSDSLAIEPAVRISSGPGREGNCMFKYNGRYYFCSSDLHGWNASQCYVISATSIQGTYSAESVMTNTGLDFCHVTQTGFFVTVSGTAGTAVIFAGDRWSDFAGNGLGFNQWCPVTFSGTTPIFNSVTKWDLNAAAGIWSVVNGNNYVLNASYEADRVTQNALAGWSNSNNLSSAIPYQNHSGGKTGNWSAQHSYTQAYQASTYQIVKGPNGAKLPPGIYSLTCWVESSGGQPTCQVYAKNYGGADLVYNVNTPLSAWTKVTISNINVTTGSVEVGVLSNANANNWVMFDDWSLTQLSLTNVKQYQRSGNVFTLTIDSFTGYTYKLQRSDALAAGSAWQDVGAAQPGLTQSNGAPSVLTFSDSAAAGTSSFYRIQIGP